MGIDKFGPDFEVITEKKGGLTDISPAKTDTVVLGGRRLMNEAVAETLAKTVKIAPFLAEDMDLLMIDLDIIYNAVDRPEIPMYLEVSFGWMDQIVRSLNCMREERGLGARILTDQFKKELSELKPEPLHKMKKLARELVEAGFVRKPKSIRPPKSL